MGISHLKDGLVAGMILGDASLKNNQFSMELCHTLPQLNYLKFKLRLLEQVGFNCRLFKLTKKNTNIGTFEYCTGTANGSNIRDYYKKSLVEFLCDLNYLGLMIWWLDDGCLSVHRKINGAVSRFGYLNTQGYNLEENQLIQRALFEKFEIETSLHIDSQSGLAKQDHWRIYFNATNIRRLIDIVRESIPWIPKDMLYKLNMQYVLNRLSNSPDLVKHYNF